MLKYEIILKSKPAINSFSLLPKKGFSKNVNIIMTYADIEEWKEDKTLNPKILFWGKFIFLKFFILIS